MNICAYNEIKVALGKIYSVGEKEMARTKKKFARGCEKRLKEI